MQRLTTCIQVLMNFGKERHQKRANELFERNTKAYDKQTSKEIEELTKSYLRGDFDIIEVGFVDGLFEMYELRELIAKTKAEIVANGMTNS